MEVVVTTGAISRAKLQSNHHHQQTNTQLFFRPDALPVAQPTVSSQSTEGNMYAACNNSSSLWIVGTWLRPGLTRDDKLSSSFLACNPRMQRTICWLHPPQRPVLGHIHCFRQCEIVGSQSLLYSAQPCDAGASSWSPPVLWRESWQDHLGICIIIHKTMCPTGVRRYDWTIAVNLGCPVILKTSSFWTNKQITNGHEKSI